MLGGAAAGAAILLVGVGFLAGTQYGGHGDTTRLVSGQGDRGGSYGRQGPFGDGPGGPFGSDQGGSRGGEGNLPGPGGQGDGQASGVVVTVGQITAIKGSSLTLSSLRGGTVTVTTSSSTVVAGKSGGDLSGLSVGQTVFVTGTRTDDGSITATAISSGPGGGGHRWGFGGGGPGDGSRDGQQDGQQGVRPGDGSADGQGAGLQVSPDTGVGDEI